MRSRGIGIGIPFWNLTGLPYKKNLLRFLSIRSGAFIYDSIGDLDAKETSLNVYDLNPYDLIDPNFEMQAMNKDNLAIWSETDRNGLTIRDLPGYNSTNPYEWLDDELDVDIINTYINPSYTARIFVNFFDNTTTLAIYDQQMNCTQSTIIHNKLKTGNWWILNRGTINACGIIKTDGIIWSK